MPSDVLFTVARYVFGTVLIFLGYECYRSRRLIWHCLRYRARRSVMNAGQGERRTSAGLRNAVCRPVPLAEPGACSTRRNRGELPPEDTFKVTRTRRQDHGHAPIKVPREDARSGRCDSRSAEEAGTPVLSEDEEDRTSDATAQSDSDDEKAGTVVEFGRVVRKLIRSFGRKPEPVCSVPLSCDLVPRRRGDGPAPRKSSGENKRDDKRGQRQGGSRSVQRAGTPVLSEDEAAGANEAGTVVEDGREGEPVGGVPLSCALVTHVANMPEIGSGVTVVPAAGTARAASRATRGSGARTFRSRG